ncbi:MAG TPA: 23S rRNA (adenine(2503)-C(2))-methyltransferase RlmN [Pirellulaceae bacterium]|nr:23S rRNA (adenine(2503)-C(2))-methyltransferase RlmN [Pirellulaceae bacterium]HMO93261.1 23S rRNA (adenine(2503)-C(2))-methyltransferase RlmN [Pirellulaceae bacterium]HMP69126.1 23S rRNA (adenine(2503)-C(2))-methyltransferase RlmN [Pirellulaceae bacterium]
MPTQHLLDQLDDLPNWLTERGYPQFRAGQIRHWLFQSRVDSFHKMTTLPLKLRDELDNEFHIFSGTTAAHQTSSDHTEKLLTRLSDGNGIESVLLREGIRRTICVSSQVGCAMGCVFCASGLDGVERNLTSGEILEQMLRLSQLLPTEERLTHIVMMGMGEPLANLENVLKALFWASHPDGLGISPRRITISTVGLPAAIKKLAEKDCRYHLAVSLHAPNDILRNEIVPVNRKIGIEAILAAADDYFEASGRRLTFEYVLLAGINDQTEHAEELGKLIAKRNILLNVIPYNPVADLPYKTPSNRAIQNFQSVLEKKYRVRIKFRKRKGDQINAACGQLRRANSNTNIVTINPPYPVSPAQ